MLLQQLRNPLCKKQIRQGRQAKEQHQNSARPRTS